MVFNKNIPQPGDRLSQSQQDLLNNNLQLNTSFDVNHYPFDDLTANNGKHKYVDLVEQGVNPAPSVGTDALFTKVDSGLGELFYLRGGSVIPIKMTSGNPLGLVNGYSFLPGGILLQWGRTGAVGSGLDVNFNVAFTTVFSVVFTGTSLTHYFSLTNLTNSLFRVQPNSGASGGSISWIAVGAGVGP